MSDIQQQVADLRGRLAQVTAQIAAAAAEHETLLAQGDALIEAYAQGELTSAVFDDRLTKLQDARLVNERRRETLATTRGRVGELLAEAEHGARLARARQDLRTRRDESRARVLAFLQAKARFLLLHYEVRELRSEIHRLSNVPGIDHEDVGGEIMDWSRLNRHITIPTEEQVDVWSAVAHQLDILNTAIDALGGDPVYADDPEVGDADLEPSAGEEGLSEEEEIALVEAALDELDAKKRGSRHA